MLRRVTLTFDSGEAYETERDARLALHAGQMAAAIHGFNESFRMKLKHGSPSVDDIWQLWRDETAGIDFDEL